MNDTQLVFNGINGSDGAYLTQPLAPGQFAEQLVGAGPPPGDLDALKARDRMSRKCLGLPFGVDAQALNEAGWAVVFPRAVDPEIREALAPLLALRAQEAGVLYREFFAQDGYLEHDTARAWLARAPRGKSPGPVIPGKVPYYLLLVASPEQVPFRFQYELSVNYAVGRIHFETVEGYRNYARSVVSASTAQRCASPRALLFGTRNKADAATQMSADLLMTPLARHMSEQCPQDWQVEQCIGESATKASLLQALSAQKPPSLIFTASHGMGFPAGDERQRGQQGALLCQDWPGPLQHRGAIPPAFYLGAEDLADDCCLSGSILMHFACYGAGTPHCDNFSQIAQPPRDIASAPFLAALPMRALSLPAGGALACVGHVERAWSYSFNWPGCEAELVTFQSTLLALMKGRRVGLAMEHFSMRQAELAVALNGELEMLRFPTYQRDDLMLGDLWTAANDARNYLIIGDPAVQL